MILLSVYSSPQPQPYSALFSLIKIDSNYFLYGNRRLSIPINRLLVTYLPKEGVSTLVPYS